MTSHEFVMFLPLEEHLSKYQRELKARSAIRYLSNWNKVGDNTGVAILKKLKRASSFRDIHLQWVPSPVNIAGNEISDALAKHGAAQPTINSAPLTYSELHSTYINNKQSTCSSCSSLDGNKVFPTCVRCSACQASPEHILDYLGLSKQDLYEDPLMVLDFLRVNEIMDWSSLARHEDEQQEQQHFCIFG
ncbi:RNase H domain-containing protein [Trichonephila clavipes]|nr:RNase H domain-containing protein [Trichonephila clavipes]